MSRRNKNKWHSVLPPPPPTDASAQVELPIRSYHRNDNEVTTRHSLTVGIPRFVYKKIFYWMDKSHPNEVSGIGKAVLIPKINMYMVQDATLVKQVNASASTELDAAAVGEALYDMRDVPGILWWWHYHQNMGVFWSGTDHKAIAEIAEGGNVLASVFNRKQESLSCYHQAALNHYPSIMYDNMSLSVIDPPDTSETAAWDKLWSDNVSEKKWQSYKPINQPYESWRERQDRVEKEDEKKIASEGAKTASGETVAQVLTTLELERNARLAKIGFTPEEIAEVNKSDMDEKDIMDGYYGHGGYYGI